MMQEWFKKAKLGIFIHWGMYSVYGIPESWAFGKAQISYNDYMKQLDGFTVDKYDPKEWAKLFKHAGARYVVLTSKHHEGVALFDTKFTDLNVIEKTPAKRDLIAPYCEAIRNEDLKVGIYFTNTDWSDIDHLCVIFNTTREEILKIYDKKFEYQECWNKYIKKETPDVNDFHTECWERFMTRYKGEIQELMTQYGDIDLLWFDVMLERNGYSWDSENVKKMINSINPNTVVNARLGEYGDYKTPECYIPLKALNQPWELSTTFNESWGYQPNDVKYKTVKQIVRMFVECISKGGNMLISVGPDASGEIPPQQQKLLMELGEWTQKYEESIFETEQGISTEYFLGGSTLSDDRKTLYLFCYDKPNEKIMLNGVRSKIKSITSLKNGRALNHQVLGGASWLNMPGCIWIDVESNDVDEVCTVIKVEFEDVIDLVELNHEENSAGEN